MLASRIFASPVPGISVLQLFIARPTPKICQARMSNSHSSAQQQPDQGNEASMSGSKFDCDIESHLSEEARTRTLSTLSKFIFGFSGIPDMVSFHGGLPPPSIFPFKSLKLETRDGKWLDIPAGDKVHICTCSRHTQPQCKQLPWLDCMCIIEPRLQCCPASVCFHVRFTLFCELFTPSSKAACILCHAGHKSLLPLCVSVYTGQVVFAIQVQICTGMPTLLQTHELRLLQMRAAFHFRVPAVHKCYSTVLLYPHWYNVAI